MEQVDNHNESANQISTTFFLLLVGCTTLFTAWISDDALIAFRSAVNFIDGYGLRWNVQERVQSFTSPLWLLIVTVSYGISRDLFVVPLLLNVAFTLWCCSLFIRRLSFSPGRQAFVVLLILLSNAFVDFSTSGLETPLLHLLLCVFFFYCGRPSSVAKQFRTGVVLGSLILLTRHDAVIIIAPCAIAWFGSYSIKELKNHGWRAVPSLFGSIIIGASPFIAWSGFSFFYYGSIVPNTAYAKLTAGVPVADLAQQGIRYLVINTLHDLATIFTLVLAIFLSFYQRSFRAFLIVLGMILHIAYVVRVGGDFMFGRFMSPAVVAALVIITEWLSIRTIPSCTRILSVCSACAIAAGGFSGVSVITYKTFKHPDFVERYFHWCPNHEFGYAWKGYFCDERGIYFDDFGLLPVLLSGEWQPELFRHSRLRDPVRLRPPYRVKIATESGEAGFRNPRNVHLLDSMALSDPLLSHLPAYTYAQRPGHYQRKIPRGYEESLARDRNMVKDGSIRLLYREVRLITRKPLFDKARIARLLSKLNRPLSRTAGQERARELP